jgi:hypothetical protein
MAETQARQRYAVYQQLAGITIPEAGSAAEAGVASPAPTGS